MNGGKQTASRDPRLRTLIVLGVTALVLIVLAILALWQQSSELAPQTSAEVVFPGLVKELRGITRIHIASKAHGAFDIEFKPEKGWVLPQRGDYPAAFSWVSRTLVGMATLQTIAPRTSRADWLAYVGLGDPAKGGNGILIALYDQTGKQAAALIAGRSEDSVAANGESGLYIRKPGDTQSWLARGVLQAQSDPANWIDKTVMDIDRARIRLVDVQPASETAYSLLRDKPTDTDFHLAALPKGREPASFAALDDAASAIVGFSFEDIRPAKQLDFSNPTQITTTTFDGLTVMLRVIKLGSEYWATVLAQAQPGKAQAAIEARTIDAHAAGWAYKLPAYKGAQLMTSLDSLLKPLAGKTLPAPHAPSP